MKEKYILFNQSHENAHFPYLQKSVGVTQFTVALRLVIKYKTCEALFIWRRNATILERRGPRYRRPVSLPPELSSDPKARAAAMLEFTLSDLRSVLDEDLHSSVDLQTLIVGSCCV